MHGRVRMVIWSYAYTHGRYRVLHHTDAPVPRGGDPWAAADRLDLRAHALRQMHLTKSTWLYARGHLHMTKST